jgi:hypothetical protein
MNAECAVWNIKTVKFIHLYPEARPAKQPSLNLVQEAITNRSLLNNAATSQPS